MAEEPKETDYTDHINKLVSQAVEALRKDFEKAHASTIEDKFREVKNSLEDSLRSGDVESKGEREALKAELAKVKEFIDKLHDTKDTAKGTTTIVIPATKVADKPEDLPEDKTVTQGSLPEATRKSRLKGWW